MAQLPALISARDVADFEAMLNDWRAGRLTNRPSHDPTRRPAPGVRRKRGVLMGPIEPPACLVDAPSTVQMRVYKIGDDGHLEATLETLTLTCFDPDMTGEAGAYCKAEWHDGVWEPYWVGCSDALADCEAPSGGT